MIFESPSPLIEILRRLLVDRELARASAHAESTSAQSEVVAT